MIGAEVVREARAMLDVPFVHQGRTRAGIDCAGLVIVCAQRLKLSTFETRAYKRVPHGGTLLKLCRENMTEIAPAEIRVGDVVVFRDREPRHLAIVGDHPFGGLSIIHAWYASGKVVESVLDESWRSRIAAAFRLPGVD